MIRELDDQRIANTEIFELILDEFPAWVVNDCYGAGHYATVAEPWRRDDRLPEDLRHGELSPSSELGGG